MPVEAKRNPNRSASMLDASRGDAGLTSSGQEFNRWRAANPETITGYACACTPRVGIEIREFDYETDSWVTRTATQADVTGWTPPPSTPGVVLDPFSGTGTTALVATMLGRTGIGVELSADYIRLAQWRCSDPKERARAAGLDPDQVSAIKKQLPGQVDMLELLAGEAS